MSRIAVIAVRLVALAALLGSAGRLTAAEKSAADLLPPSTLLYVQISQPKDVIGLVLDHPLRGDLEQSPTFRQALEAPQFKQFRAVIGLIEKQTGIPWRQALEATTGGGAVLAVDPITGSAVLLLRPDDSKTTQVVRDAFFSLARQDAKNKGKPDPIEVKTYRGLTAYMAGDATIADLGPWLLLGNKQGFARAVADKFLDGGEALADDRDFRAARDLATAGGAKPGVWAFVRLAPLRAMATGQPWLDPKNKSDNPAAAFLLGGLIPTLQKAPYLAASLQLDRQAIKLSVAAPSDPSWVPAESKFYFATAGDGAAKPLRPKNLALSVSAYRDVSAMWQAGPDLFTESIAAQMAQTDSGLSAVFGGKSFSGEVLGAIKPQFQLVAVRRDFKAEGARQPSVRFPAAALVLRVKPDQFAAVRRHFRVGFQSLVAFANLDGASKGRPLLEIQTEKRGDAEIQFATYGDVDNDAAKDKKATADDAGAGKAKQDMYLNLSPALVMSPDHMILSTSKNLAEELADLAQTADANATISENTMIEVNAQRAAELIRDNREQLIAQNMLEKGHDRAAAEKEIDVLQALVSYFEGAKLQLMPAEKSIRLDLELKIRSK